MKEMRYYFDCSVPMGHGDNLNISLGFVANIWHKYRFYFDSINNNDDDLKLEECCVHFTTISLSE